MISYIGEKEKEKQLDHLSFKKDVPWLYERHLDTADTATWRKVNYSIDYFY